MSGTGVRPSAGHDPKPRRSLEDEPPARWVAPSAIDATGRPLGQKLRLLALPALTTTTLFDKILPG